MSVIVADLFAFGINYNPICEGPKYIPKLASLPCSGKLRATDTLPPSIRPEPLEHA